MIADLQRHAEIEQALRARHDARGEAAARMRQWFAERLPTMEPAPGQRHDSHIEPYIGLTSIAKGLTVPRYYARTHKLERRNGHLLAEVELNLNQLPAARLREAFQKAGRLALRQMRNADLRLAGTLIDSEVSPDSVVSLRLAVTDPAAMAKLGSKTYSGIVLTFDEGEVADISLVDAPVDFVGEFAKRNPEVIAKVFSNESQVMSKLMKKAKKMSKRTGYPVAACADALAKVKKGPVLSPSATQALSRYDQAVAAVPGAGDQMAAKAAVGRALGDIGVEMVKAARSRPVAIGPDGLVGFLRHGRR